MKIALVFLLLIGAVVLGLPFSIKGDSSITGAVQSFMSYAFSATGVLLGFLTIFMSRSLSDELAGKQIFLTVTKPIPRWQFILGKWLGMVLLTGSFLLCAGVTVYGMVRYIKRTHPPLDEKYDVAELTNDLILYQPTREAFAQQGYETLAGANRIAIEGIECIVGTASALLNDLSAAGDGPDTRS